MGQYEEYENLEYHALNTEHKERYEDLTKLLRIMETIVKNKGKTLGANEKSIGKLIQEIKNTRDGLIIGKLPATDAVRILVNQTGHWKSIFGELK